MSIEKRKGSQHVPRKIYPKLSLTYLFFILEKLVLSKNIAKYKKKQFLLSRTYGLQDTNSAQTLALQISKKEENVPKSWEAIINDVKQKGKG